MDIHNVRDPTSKVELKELTNLLKEYTKAKGLTPMDGKKMRAQIKRKIKHDGFTDVDQAWESIHSPPAPEPVPAPEPEEEESPQEDP